MMSLPPELANIEFVHGIPQVERLPHDELRTPAGDVYMRRYYLKRAVRKTKASDWRFHHILASDADRHLHDHPWDFTTWILHGEYVETTPEGNTTYRAGDVLHRKAQDLHRLTLEQPVWTYFKTGPPVRKWGFQTEDGWIYHRAYHARQIRTSREW